MPRVVPIHHLTTSSHFVNRFVSQRIVFILFEEIHSVFITTSKTYPNGIGPLRWNKKPGFFNRLSVDDLAVGNFVALLPDWYRSIA